MQTLHGEGTYTPQSRLGHRRNSLPIRDSESRLLSSSDHSQSKLRADAPVFHASSPFEPPHELQARPVEPALSYRLQYDETVLQSFKRLLARHWLKLVPPNILESPDQPPFAGEPWTARCQSGLRAVYTSSFAVADREAPVPEVKVPETFRVLHQDDTQHYAVVKVAVNQEDSITGGQWFQLRQKLLLLKHHFQLEQDSRLQHNLLLPHRDQEKMRQKHLQSQQNLLRLPTPINSVDPEWSLDTWCTPSEVVIILRAIHRSTYLQIYYVIVPSYKSLQGFFLKFYKNIISLTTEKTAHISPSSLSLCLTSWPGKQNNYHRFDLDVMEPDMDVVRRFTTLGGKYYEDTSLWGKDCAAAGQHRLFIHPLKTENQILALLDSTGPTEAINFRVDVAALVLCKYYEAVLQKAMSAPPSFKAFVTHFISHSPSHGVETTEGSMLLEIPPHPGFNSENWTEVDINAWTEFWFFLREELLGLQTMQRSPEYKLYKPNAMTPEEKHGWMRLHTSSLPPAPLDGWNFVSSCESKSVALKLRAQASLNAPEEYVVTYTITPTEEALQAFFTRLYSSLVNLGITNYYRQVGHPRRKEKTEPKVGAGSISERQIRSIIMAEAEADAEEDREEEREEERATTTAGGPARAQAKKTPLTEAQLKRAQRKERAREKAKANLKVEEEESEFQQQVRLQIQAGATLPPSVRMEEWPGKKDNTHDDGSFSIDVLEPDERRWKKINSLIGLTTRRVISCRFAGFPTIPKCEEAHGSDAPGSTDPLVLVLSVKEVPWADLDGKVWSTGVFFNVAHRRWPYTEASSESRSSDGGVLTSENSHNEFMSDDESESEKEEEAVSQQENSPSDTDSEPSSVTDMDSEPDNIIGKRRKRILFWPPLTEEEKREEENRKKCRERREREEVNKKQLDPAKHHLSPRPLNSLVKVLSRRGRMSNMY